MLPPSVDGCKALRPFQGDATVQLMALDASSTSSNSRAGAALRGETRVRAVAQSLTERGQAGRRADRQAGRATAGVLRLFRRGAAGRALVAGLFGANGSAFERRQRRNLGAGTCSTPAQFAPGWRWRACFECECLSPRAPPRPCCHPPTACCLERLPSSALSSEHLC